MTSKFKPCIVWIPATNAGEPIEGTNEHRAPEPGWETVYCPAFLENQEELDEVFVGLVEAGKNLDDVIVTGPDKKWEINVRVSS